MFICSSENLNILNLLLNRTEMDSKRELTKPQIICDRIYQLKLPIPSSEFMYLLSYFVEGESEYLLVDSGWNSTVGFDALEKQLSEIKVDLSDISLILVTHLHPDHYGLAHEIQKKSKSKIVMGIKAYEFIKRFKSFKDYFDKLIDWLKINGYPIKDLGDWVKESPAVMKSFEPQKPDIFMKDNEILDLGNFSFKVVETPGHSPDHICLYEPRSKLLFSGDHILPTITPNVSLPVKDFGNPLKDYLESLEKIRNLGVEKVLPAHEYAFNNLNKRVSDIEKHHEVRLREVLRVLKNPKTAYQIAQEVTWSTGPWKRLQKWEQRTAVFETLAHLEYLKYEGKLFSVIRNENVLFYK